MISFAKRWLVSTGVIICDCELGFDRGVAAHALRG